MSTLAPVFHYVPKPVTVQEFRDAVLGTCRPRYPTVRYARPQRIALAISGGVDSMALAFLFSSLLQSNRGIKIADNPIESAYGIVVDHKLRKNSTKEAVQVANELRRLGLRGIIQPLTWRKERRQCIDPSNLPNLESRARTLRYQALGNACLSLRTNGLFFAHHRDDQYETVLMRLLAGHGYRGLQGIRNANAIPECYDVHGVYNSGLLDDQMRSFPFLSFRPPAREMRRLRKVLRNEKPSDSWDHLRISLGINDLSAHFPGHITREVDPGVPYLKPLNSEEGGILVYRPLLEFDKSRLIATCEANHVTWFEDHTNEDPALTTRNALRHILKHHTLPHALQKPAVLGLCRRSKRRAAAEEAEASRLLVRSAAIQDFDPNVGSLVLEPPLLRTARKRRHHSSTPAQLEIRNTHQRIVAATLIRKAIEFVTPERHLPPLSNLENAVRRVFPYLYPDADPVPVKAFSIAGVLFDPIESPDSLRWFLSRAPYSSSKVPPKRRLPGYIDYSLNLMKDGVEEHLNRPLQWRSWRSAKLWDGRFWIRASTRVAARFHIKPFLPEHAKGFRMALPPKERARLESVLKYYAPGKVRYSLPALYCVEDTDVIGKDGLPLEKLVLLALPSLGIHIPGLERWVKYEARYKKVDIGLLGPHRRRSRMRATVSSHPRRFIASRNLPQRRYASMFSEQSQKLPRKRKRL